MIKKIGLLTLIVAVVSAYFALDTRTLLDADYFRQIYQQNPVQSALIYFFVYLLVTGFSLPAAALLTVIGGMIFGLYTGTLLVSFASSIGATLACAFSRYLLRDWVQHRLGQRFEKIDKGVASGGGSYLFSLRLIPVFPFWVINLAFGLTRMPLSKFYWVSQLGMFPATLVFVNAGAQLGALDSFSAKAVLSPSVILSFLLLALFPYIVKAVALAWSRRQRYKAYTRPSSYDANLIVIGAGSGGLVAAYIAAAVKAKVILIERDKMGGDCLNTGCVPSKALIRSAKAAAEVRKAADFGVQVGDPKVDFPRVMARVRGAIETIAPNDSVERYSQLGVVCRMGSARLVSPWEVEVNGERLSARSIVIATGARPHIPDIPGLDTCPFVTTDTLWQLEELPPRLLVLGGGPVGSEMAQAFQRLGSQVTLVQRRAQLLPSVDSDVAEALISKLKAEDVDLLLDAELDRIVGNVAEVKLGETVVEVAFDLALLATGRQANTEGLGLKELGIAVAENGTLEVNKFLQTNFPNIYGCGDVCGPFQFTHASSHQAWHATVNSLFGRFKKFSVDYSLLPSVIYTDPEVASVGETEKSLQQKGVEHEVVRFPLSDLDRAVTDGTTEGLVKVITAKGKDRILGVAIVAPRAGEMLGEFIAAMKNKKGFNSILATIHAYPGYLEANKLAAGRWKKDHAPERLLGLVEKYHQWLRK